MRLLILILSLPIICNATDLEAIHSRAIVLDAHADIEIPGQESRYAGAKVGVPSACHRGPCQDPLQPP